MGALALQHAAINDDFRSIIDRLLNENVTSTTDRELFNLAPHNDHKENT